MSGISDFEASVVIIMVYIGILFLREKYESR